MDISQRAAGLDADHLVFGAIFALANRLQRVMDALLPELTTKQWWLLVVLSLFPEPPTLTELAEAADTSHQNVRQILAKLEAKGFVTLTPDPRDRRVSRVAATARADEWGAASDEPARHLMAAMYAGLSADDLGRLAQHLLGIHANLGRLPEA
jgi:DNA-binding MarR family transcriptional regulator